MLMYNNIEMYLKKYPEGEHREVFAFHDYIIDRYPGLLVRWVKIYGKRWAYLHGNSTETGFNAVQFRLNRKYGLCIDNPDTIPSDELDALITMIREHFAY